MNKIDKDFARSMEAVVVSDAEVLRHLAHLIHVKPGFKKTVMEMIEGCANEEYKNRKTYKKSMQKEKK